MLPKNSQEFQIRSNIIMLPKKFSTFSRPMQHNSVPEIVDIISAHFLHPGIWFFDLRWSLILGNLISADLWSFGLRWSLIFWSELIFDLWSFSKVDRFLIFDLQLFLTFWSLIFSWSDLLTFDLWTPQFMLSWSKFKKNRGCFGKNTNTFRTLWAKPQIFLRSEAPPWR